MTKRILAMTAALVFILAAVLTAYAAENAKGVETAGGRSVIIHEVSGTKGEATIVRGQKTFAPSRGVRLAQGDVLKTTGDHKIYLAIDSSMILRLDPEGEAEITKSTFGQKLTVTVVKGQMFYNVAKQNGGNASLELMTNNVTIAVRGTSGELGTKNGAIQHMLFDGVVEVSDGDNTFEQKPGEMLEARMGPSNDITADLEVREFTLAEVPQSLVEEMKADEQLKERILGSVPYAVNPDGTPVYADAATFEEKVTGVADSVVFETTAIPSSVEPEEEKKAAEPEPEPAPAPEPEPEPTPEPEPEPKPEPEPEPEPETEVCPGCKETITKGDPAHAKKTFDCGDEDYACCAAKHEKLHCDDCDEDYYKCNAEDVDKHAFLSAEEMTCGGACCKDRGGMCKAKYEVDDHKLLYYPCNLCSDYACVYDTEHKNDHKAFDMNTLPCGGHEGMQPVCETDTMAVEALMEEHAQFETDCGHDVFECMSDDEKSMHVNAEYYDPCTSCGGSHWTCEGCLPPPL